MVDLKLNERYAERIFDMKKFTGLVLALIMLCSTASAEEILFRGIPWGTNVLDVLSSLELIDADGVDKNSGVDVHKLVHVYESDVEEFGSQRLIGYSSFEDCGYICTPVIASDMVVAEYKVAWLELQFLFGITDEKVSCKKSDSEFYSGKYEFRPDDYVSAYEDLVGKLTWLYGEPVVEETVENDSYFTKHRHEKYARWDGANDTSVLLYVKYYTDDTNKYQYELSIEYAKTDIEDRIAFIEQFFAQKERDIKYNDVNTEGL